MGMELSIVLGIRMSVRGLERQLRVLDFVVVIGPTLRLTRGFLIVIARRIRTRGVTSILAAAAFASHRSRGDKGTGGAQASKKPEPHLQYRANLSPQNHPHDDFITV